MNQSKTAVIIDSGCDLSNELIQKYDIKVLRLKVMYGNDVYNDGLDIDPLEIYKRFPKEIPTTSTPNLYEVKELLKSIRAEGYERAIAITISSGLSGTYNAVAAAFKEFKDMECFAFDSRNISIGSGLFALWAAKKAEEGMNFRDICNGLSDKVGDSKVFFYMDTLDYLRKGGRISPAVATVGKVLNLKPIISCNSEGTYYTEAKIRGANKGLTKLIEKVSAYVSDSRAKGSRVCLALMNGNAPETALQLKPQLLAAIPSAEIIVEKQITATMAINTGPGLIGVGVFIED